jgi:hypothetical protein
LDAVWERQTASPRRLRRSELCVVQKLSRALVPRWEEWSHHNMCDVTRTIIRFAFPSRATSMCSCLGFGLICFVVSRNLFNANRASKRDRTTTIWISFRVISQRKQCVTFYTFQNNG